ncbi:MAG TPA: lipocalin-like domain-containing protein [Candidatus Limnocylindria bacterium]
MGDERFIGAWRLVYCEYVLPQGLTTYPFGAAPRGTLAFAADGQVRITLDEAIVGFIRWVAEMIAVGAVLPSLPEPAMTHRDIPFVGRYEVTESHVIYHIETSPWPGWNGRTSRPPYAFRKKSLFISINDVPLPGVLSFIWERAETSD